MQPRPANVGAAYGIHKGEAQSAVHFDAQFLSVLQIVGFYDHFCFFFAQLLFMSKRKNAVFIDFSGVCVGACWLF